MLGKGVAQSISGGNLLAARSNIFQKLGINVMAENICGNCTRTIKLDFAASETYVKRPDSHGREFR
jgi:chemotaxis receptor (MCP) glutamine deamidase CheD